MSAAASPPPPATARPPSAGPAATVESLPLWRRLLAPLSSLRLTVTLLAFSLLLVFFGTLAQTEDGLYVAQEKYFRSLFAVWSPHDPGWKWIKVPLPGGYLLGTLLLVNVTAATLTRFKWTWKKSGILMTHFGVIMLLLGQLATDLFSRESRMSFAEGEWRNYSEDFHKTELAFRTDTDDPAMDFVVAIPETVLARGGEITHPRLPFKLRVQQYSENSTIRARGPMVDSNRPPAATQGAGARAVVEAVAATRAMDQRNLPATVVELLSTNGTSVGTWLFGLVLDDQPVDAGGQTWRAGLRQMRYYEPFSVKLLKTTHETYRGTDIPKNFQSRVLLDQPDTREHREVDIYMNNPLRYAGLTFFQHQMGRDEVNLARGTSVLQVVQNPSWLSPYLGTVFVFAGLLVQFLIHLVGFVRKRRA